MNDTLILDGDLVIDVNIDGEPDSVIAVGHETIVHPISITENGYYEPESGVDGFSSVDVDVKYQDLIDYISEVTGGEDTSLSDAVESLVAGYGGGDPLASINPLLDGIYFRAGENLLPSTLTIDISNLRFFGLPDSWTIFSGLQHLIVTGEKKIETSTGYGLINNVCVFHAQHCRGIKDITFVSGARLSGSLPGFFAYFNELEAIYGELDYTDVTAWTYNDPFANNSLLKHLRLKRDSAQTISRLAYNSLSALDDESLISIGNGLGVVTDTHNLALHSTKKTRCSTLMGNNVDGLFVADENGTMSLADFITTIKGWTLA